LSRGKEQTNERFAIIHESNTLMKQGFDDFSSTIHRIKAKTSVSEFPRQAASNGTPTAPQKLKLVL